MMLCNRCNKRPAVVFVSSSADTSNTVGYCLACAKELGVKPVTDIMEKMGISEDDIDSIQEQMDDLADSGFIPGAEMFEGIEGEDDEDGDFSRGGAPTFPPFFKNLFNSKSPSDKLSDKEKGEEKQNKKETQKKRKGRKHIDAYCTNLTRRAADGELDRIIGRDKEIDRVVQILSRRTKNNPCLIGEPGVGKTAIVKKEDLPGNINQALSIIRLSKDSNITKEYFNL